MKKSIVLAIISGILLSLPFYWGGLWITAWFGFVPVFMALLNKSRLQSFVIFFIHGIVFWALTVYWLAHVTLPGMIILVIYLSLYPAFFGFIIRPFTVKSRLSDLVLAPAVWVALEYVRGHLFSGFPWALLGYSQYLNLPIIQISDITGVLGISFLIVFINICLVELIYSLRTAQTARAVRVLIVIFFVEAVCLIYGLSKLSAPAAKTDNAIMISILQGNIPQEYKWDPDKNEFIMGRYISLSAQAALGSPGLIVWPEAAFPVIPEEEPFYYKRAFDFSVSSGIPLLIGAVTQREGIYYNSALLVSPNGEHARYDKLHLVPFGEYIPLKGVFPFLEGIVPIADIAPGREFKLFRIDAGKENEVKFSVLICFEDVFSGISRNFVNRGAGFLINITNDAWYKMSPASYQHLQASVFRAVENRVPVARSANTGISCFIAPTGQITSVVREGAKELFVEGYLTKTIDVKVGGKTFYCRFGDLFVLFCFIVCLVYYLRGRSN